MHTRPLVPILTPYGPRLRPVGGPELGTFGVLPPPNHALGSELQYVRYRAATRTPWGDRWAQVMDKAGATSMWFQLAREARWGTGLRGWLNTGVMAAAMGVGGLASKFAKSHYDRPRPFQLDPSLPVPVKLPEDNGYPSGHAAAAFAAATVLSHMNPWRAAEFHRWADAVADSRVYAGVHFPSDVVAGAQLGTRIGRAFARLVS